jgi:hypothetical protein
MAAATPFVEIAMELLLALAAIIPIIAIERGHVAIAPAPIMLVRVVAVAASFSGTISVAAEHEPTVRLTGVRVDLPVRAVAVAEIAMSH